MRIVETRGKIAEDGCILLPPGVLESMRMEAGDSISLAYLSHHPETPVNSYGEFFLTQHGIDSVGGPVEGPEQAELSIPHAMLVQAQIPLDADLDIQVMPGGIVIGMADPLDTVPELLMKLFTDLGIQPEAVRKVLEKGGFPDEQW